jgi:hypothetical protein
MYGGAPLLSTLAFAPDMRAGTKGHVRAPQMDQLGDPETGLDRECQEQPIASADPRGRVWSAEERLNLIRTEEGHGVVHMDVAEIGGQQRQESPGDHCRDGTVCA